MMKNIFLSLLLALVKQGDITSADWIDEDFSKIVLSTGKDTYSITVIKEKKI